MAAILQAGVSRVHAQCQSGIPASGDRLDVRETPTARSSARADGQVWANDALAVASDDGRDDLSANEGDEERNRRTVHELYFISTIRVT
jgi:hypothetical protein